MLTLMFQNMEISYWEQNKPSGVINGTFNTRKNDESPPLQQNKPFHSHFLKEENSIYQYCDRNFNFTATSNGGGIGGGGTSEDDDYHHTCPKKKMTVTRGRYLISMGSREEWSECSHQIGGCKKDPMSHRIIEKRRRDRMNNCLADLSRLIPADYLKKGRGRIEKTEIIEMAIKHMKFLQSNSCQNGGSYNNRDRSPPNGFCSEKQRMNESPPCRSELSTKDNYKLGYQECLTETMHFLVEIEGYYPSDPLCVKLINHLQEYYEKIVKGEKLVFRNPPSRENSPHEPLGEYVNGNDKIIANSLECAHSEDSQETVSFGAAHLQNLNNEPHVDALYMPQVRPNIIRHSSPDRGSLQADSGDHHSSTGSLYKFKNNIKERFSAEHPPSPPITVVTTARPPPPLRLPPSQPVPIFALHANGAFYVPLTVDSRILEPLVTRERAALALHPVTISVNFAGPRECKPRQLERVGGPMIMVSGCR